MRITNTNLQPDRPRVKASEIYQTVPLNLAQLCLDCSSVYDQRAGACPTCGSKASLGLLRVVDRKVTR